MNTNLSGQVVLVTGASGGIGSAIAQQFAAEGARLVIHYHRQREAALALQRQFGKLGKGIESILVQADLTREAGTQKLFAAAIKRFGRVDTLVANAGSWANESEDLPDISLKRWRWTLDCVLTSTFLTTREFFRIVRRQKRGNAVLVGSTAAVFGEAGHADYAAAKAAMTHGLVRTLKNELARLAPHTRDYCGGRINCVSPGWTLIPRTAARLKNPDAVRKVTATMALPQVARPEDIANAIVFLSSDTLARHITGQNLVVAGGMEGRWLWQPEEVDPDIV
jgi:3-oxoacyl-[acyl-carrier protein] reductase